MSQQRRAAREVARQRASPPCWTRCLLALFSLLGLSLGACLLAYPAMHYHITNVWDFPRNVWQCSMDGGVRVARPGRLLQSAVSAPPPHPPGAAPTPALSADSLFSSATRPEPSAVATAAAVPAAQPDLPTYQPPAGATVPGGADGASASALTSYGFDVTRDGVKAIIVAAGVMMLISGLGLSLACCRPSHARGLLTALFVCCGLPSWVLLVFVSVLIFRARGEADLLVRRRVAAREETGV